MTDSPESVAADVIDVAADKAARAIVTAIVTAATTEIVRTRPELALRLLLDERALASLVKHCQDESSHANTLQAALQAASDTGKELGFQPAKHLLANSLVMIGAVAARRWMEECA